MRKKYFIFAFLLFLSILVSTSFAQWQNVTTGIDYQPFVVTVGSGRNEVFVSRMLRSDTECIIDACIANGKVCSNGGRQTVSQMANRYEDSISYWDEQWGKRYDVVAAINGDYWDTTNNTALGGIITSGVYAKRFSELTGGSGFGYKLPGPGRYPFLGGCVGHRPFKQLIIYPDTTTSQFDGINVTRDSNQIIVYTQHFGPKTPTQTTGVDVLVEMSRMPGIYPSPNGGLGTVKEIRQNQGDTYIPFDHAVISASGSKATTLLSKISVGSAIKISNEITDYQGDCNTTSSFDWTKTFSSIGGTGVVLQGGIVLSQTNTDVHPRTAVAYNADYIFFIVVDGRRAPTSYGMTFQELGEFCLNNLGATDATSQDGGGSSCLWVNGQVKNQPSDGSERATYDGLMMIRLLAKVQTTTYSAGASVYAPSGTTVYLGPGSNHHVLGSAPTGQQGTIVAHSVNGVSAKGKNWWKWSYGTTTGWSSEDTLASYPPSKIPEWMLY